MDIQMEKEINSNSNGLINMLNVVESILTSFGIYKNKDNKERTNELDFNDIFNVIDLIEKKYE
jgi:hypothetical protein